MHVLVLILLACLVAVAAAALIRHQVARLATVAFIAMLTYSWAQGAHTANSIIGAVSAAPARSGNASIVSYGSVLDAVDHGSAITASAYTLSSRSALLYHLQDAARRGAKVDLALTGDGMGYAVSGNRRLASREHAFHVVLTDEPLHLKAVVVDHGAGGVFVSDRNWTAHGSLVLRLPAAYALPVLRAVIGDPHSAGPLTTTKGESLAAEARALRSATKWIALESESFGANNAVYSALYDAARRGVHVTVLVARREFSDSPTEQDAVARLESAGVRAALSDNDQKIAVVDGRLGWLGSSNATSGVENQVDWGFTTQDRTLVAQLARAIGEDAP